MVKAKSRKDIDSKLLESSQKGKKDEIISCLGKGASVHTEAEQTNNTPLHLAVESNVTEAVECLLESGAEPNRLNKDGKTPLHLASAAGNKQAIETLLLYGANKFVPDNKGETPLSMSPVECFPVFGVTRPRVNRKPIPTTDEFPPFSMDIFPDYHAGVRELAPRSVGVPQPFVPPMADGETPPTPGGRRPVPAPIPAPLPVGGMPRGGAPLPLPLPTPLAAPLPPILSPTLPPPPPTRK